MPTRDYVAWHDEYDRPGSRLHLRLLVVQDLLSRALDELPAGPVRVISMCAGQGRDILGVAARHRRGADVHGRLVELDSSNVAAARAAAPSDRFEVVEADAGASDAYIGAAPADLVVACGILGNITDDDIERTIAFLPALCAPGARVVWTRHPKQPGIIASIEAWLERAGSVDDALVVPEDLSFGVGLARFTGDAAALAPGQRIFDFVR